MISLSPETPPPPDNSDFGRLMMLLEFVTDPKAVASRVLDIVNEREASYDIIQQGKAAKDELEKTRETMAAELKAHAEQLAAERARFDSKCGTAMDEVKKREAESIRLNTQAKADAEAASKMRADMEGRLEKIRSAVA